MRWLEGITDLMDLSFSKHLREMRTGKSGVLQFMASQRVRYDLATEQKQQILKEVISGQWNLRIKGLTGG